MGVIKMPKEPDPPYKFEPYPCHMYRRSGGVVTNMICRDKAAHVKALSDGWVDTPAELPEVDEGGSDDRDDQIAALLDENEKLRAQLEQFTKDISANNSGTSAKNSGSDNKGDKGGSSKK